jgi:myo-inositol 2-dehydrogenase / D-chiro-inositol 1-dehydrogenase
MTEKPNPTRRSLVRAASLIPLAAAASSANSAITVGLIGAGGRGTFVTGLMAKHAGARVVALCDLFDERIEAARQRLPAPDAKGYRDYRDLLATDVDAVVIATPVHVHPEHCEAAVKAGKHVWFEKPVAADVAGCKRIMRAADSANPRQNITVGFQRRYGQVFRKAKAAADAGAIGPIRMAHSRWLKGIADIGRPSTPRPATEEALVREWRWWRDTSGDSLVETFIHGVDVLNWFLGGRPLKAHGTGGRTVIRHGDTLDHVHVTYDYANDVQASVVGSLITPPFYRSVQEEFFGAAGVLETSQNHWAHHRGRNEVVREASPRDITIDAAEAFIERLRSGKPENTGIEAANSTLTAILGQMAIDLRREVTWDEMMRSA